LQVLKYSSNLLILHSYFLSCSVTMNDLKKYITIDPEIQHGKPVFRGTRVPVETLFWHLEKEISIEEFLEDFPSVTKEQALGVI